VPPTEYATQFEALHGPNPLGFRRGTFPPEWGTPPAGEEARARWIRRHAQLERAKKDPWYALELLDVRVRNENRLRLLEVLEKSLPPV
jgi:hypothetical protein